MSALRIIFFLFSSGTAAMLYLPVRMLFVIGPGVHGSLAVAALCRSALFGAAFTPHGCNCRCGCSTRCAAGFPCLLFSVKLGDHSSFSAGALCRSTAHSVRLLLPIVESAAALHGKTANLRESTRIFASRMPFGPAPTSSLRLSSIAGRGRAAKD